jgi:hypothetical protein
LAEGAKVDLEWQEHTVLVSASGSVVLAGRFVGGQASPSEAADVGRVGTVLLGGIVHVNTATGDNEGAIGARGTISVVIGGLNANSVSSDFIDVGRKVGGVRAYTMTCTALFRVAVGALSVAEGAREARRGVDEGPEIAKAIITPSLVPSRQFKAIITSRGTIDACVSREGRVDAEIFAIGVRHSSGTSHPVARVVGKASKVVSFDGYPVPWASR